MSTILSPKIGHADIVAFAEERVNLKRDDVKEERAQVQRLRDRLADHIAANPEFDLVKMIGSGSLAKGTSLKTINDIDVAVYVKQGEAPTDESALLEWIAERLRDAYGKLVRPDQIQPGVHAVTISFYGTGLDVDVVPILYEGDEELYGYLITDTGDRVLTCIPRHLEFIRTRKKSWPKHFRQLIRLTKWWAKTQGEANRAFRCKSFMLELIVAKSFDDGLDGSDYPRALEQIFSCIVKGGLKEKIVFGDYYSPADVKTDGRPIQIYDPVNPVNNVAARYSDGERSAIVAAATAALEAITYASYATTKAIALGQWRKVFGPEFSA
ncbi:MAG TPA: CBASS oligonucleotide cyclase [Candidatus Tumulicola sp.]|nr:CBASS oligonucleotide cyclase [Candidatus Tumulicola sp.]